MTSPLGRAFVQVFADLSKFTPGLRKEIKSALDEQTKGLQFDELDKSARKAGESAADEVGKGVQSKIKNNMDKAGQQGGMSLGRGLARGFSIAASAALPALIAYAVQLVAALAPAAVALGATLPVAVTTLAASIGVLMMATNGVGEALKNAFDPAKAEAFNEAMKKLAPAAQSFVREIQALQPAFKALQQDVQQTFFVQLQGVLTRVSRVLLPTLRRGLRDISADLGKMGANLLGVFANRQADIATMFTAAHQAMQPFIKAWGELLTALLMVGAAASPLFVSLSTGFAGLLSDFGAFIAAAEDSGALQQFFADALVILQQFGALLGAVFDLVGSLIGALQVDGAEALGFLTGLITQIAAFFASAEGAEMLSAVFGLLNQLLASMQEVLTPLLPAIGGLVTALAGGLTDALKVITPYLADAAKWLGEHPELLEAAAIAWGVYKVALMAVAAYQAIVLATNPVGWIILAIAAIAAGAYLIYKNWDAVTSALTTAWEAIKGFFSGIWGWIQSVGGAIGNWFTVTLPAFFASIPGKIWAALSALPGMLQSLFLAALNAAGTAIGVGVGLILAYFIKMPGWIWEGIKAIGNIFVDLWNLAFSLGAQALATGVQAVIYIFTVLPGKIATWVNKLPGIIGGAFKSAWDWAKRMVVDGAEAVIRFVQKLPGRISGFFSNIGSSILGGLKSGINAVIGGFNNGINRVASAIHIDLPNLPMLAAGGLINAPTLAIVGEAGPEAVIPMSDPARAAAVAQKTGLLDILGSRMGNVGTTLVKVYLGTREITDILNVQIDKKLGDQANELAYGAR